MAALGPCNNLASLSFVSLNELTTVASVYALAPFMAGPANAYTKVGTSANNAMGLKNALADVNVLVNLATGTTPGSTTVAGLTLPTSEINTLADIIAACVNSAGGSYNDGSACGTLFANADPGGTAFTAPTDTITALMNIAQHPATSTANLAALYTLATPTAPFQPTLTSQPKDFTLALTFAGATNAPSALAADAAGNVWITNVGNNTVTELAHTGVVLSGAGYTASLAHPNAIAFAPDGTAWITNAGNSTVSRLTPTGAAYPGSPYSGGGLDVPRSIAFDSSGTAWIANNISVTTINSAGSTLTNYAHSAVTGNIVAIAVNPH
jgi:streptogramin lyase